MRPFREAAIVAVALAAALIVAFLLFRLPVADSLRGIAAGAFGDRYALGRTAAKATPLLLTSLGIAAAWRAGAYNIGGEGQFVLGAAAAAAWALVPCPGLPLFGLIAASIGGAIWAGLAAGLNRWRKVDIVVATILLNFVAINFLGFLVAGLLRDPATTSPLTIQLGTERMLWRPNRQLDLHAGFLIALALVPLLHLFFRKSWPGFVHALSGQNPMMARANRIDAGRARSQALVLSGALCGLAGGVEYLGVTGQVGAGFAAGWGFVAIPVALLGGRSAFGVALAALLFGALFAGSDDLSRTAAGGSNMVYVAQALCLLFVLGARRIGRIQAVAA